MTGGQRTAPSPGRRCRRRPIAPGHPRPSALLAAFFAAALVQMLCGAVAAGAYEVTGREWLHWVALHLVLLGGVSQLVLGAAQFFTCAFLATDPPTRRVVGCQLAAWNAGAVLVAIGVPAGATAVVETGAALLGTSLILFALALRGMQRRSLQRAPWALRWYQASAGFLALGGLVGVLLARAMSWTHGDLLGAHLALTLAGWLGTAIIGTLHTFFPSLTQAQLRHPRLQRATYALWLLGVVELTLGAAFASRAGLAAGWTDLLIAASFLCVNLLACLRAAPRPLSLPARLLALAQAFLLAGLAVAMAATVTAGVEGPFQSGWRPALAVLLLAGWIGLTVAGSLLHLLAILGRIRRFSLAIPAPRPTGDRALVCLAAVAIGLLAPSKALGLAPLEAPATALALALAAVMALRVMLLAARALVPGSVPRRLAPELHRTGVPTAPRG